jgi:hypothetical protein
MTGGEVATKRYDRPDPIPPAPSTLPRGSDNLGERSGPVIPHPRSGWALSARATRAHWYDRVHERDRPVMLRRLCDQALYWPGAMFDPGTFATCPLCRAAIVRGEQ